MKLILIIFILSLLGSTYSSQCTPALTLELDELSHLKDRFWNFLADQSPLHVPNPTLSGYFAHHTRLLIDTVDIDHRTPKITYCASGKIYTEGNVGAHKSELTKIMEAWDEITRDVLYGPREYYLSNHKPSEMTQLILDYNINCIVTDIACSSIQQAEQLHMSFEVNTTFPVKEVCNLEYSSVKCLERARTIIILSRDKTSFIKFTNLTAYQMFVSIIQWVVGMDH